MEILVAFLVVGAIGLAAGLLIAVMSRFFGVEEDQTVKAVRACLPGVNCGACGYKGCDDYAAAVAEGKAKPNLCVPGAESTAEELGALLGIEVEPPKDVVAFVHCNGNCEATATKADYVGVTSCKAAAMLYGGPESCQYGCMGFGDCAVACPAGAICMKDGIAHVDTSRCLGCGLCESICPKKVISMVPQETAVVVMCNNKDKGAEARKACKNACIGCMKCVKACPQEAITVTNNLAKIDYDKCVRCGACAAGCPTGCLKQVFFPDLSEEFEDFKVE
ncbi:MAG: RnfABCDGE type electron transport complex subunit B [Lachnospiraceae bacterium]|nr:RnfABCDGE type electron transport complex subunit B [Lachnospiraceae bacterium]